MDHFLRVELEAQYPRTWFLLLVFRLLLQYWYLVVELYEGLISFD